MLSASVRPQRACAWYRRKAMRKIGIVTQNPNSRMPPTRARK
jgi:hypothetical protein